MYKCIAHYIAKVVTEKEKKEENLDPTNYMYTLQEKFLYFSAVMDPSKLTGFMSFFRVYIIYWRIYNLSPSTITALAGLIPGVEGTGCCWG